MTTFDRSTLATSRYDAISLPPLFTWSTPMDRHVIPWRVAWPSRLHALIVGARLDAGSTVDDRYADLHVDYHRDVNGRRTLEVWLRDNRDHEAHWRRLCALAGWLCREGLMARYGGLPTADANFTGCEYLLVSDDLSIDHEPTKG